MEEFLKLIVPLGFWEINGTCVISWCEFKPSRLYVSSGIPALCLWASRVSLLVVWNRGVLYYAR